VLLQYIIDEVVTDKDADDVSFSTCTGRHTWNNKVPVADCSIMECEKLQEITAELQVHLLPLSLIQTGDHS